MVFKNNVVQSDILLNESIQSMLNDHLGNDIVKNFEDNLSESQKDVFKMFKRGDNLLILSSAGHGKSFLIKTMQEYINKQQISKNISLCSTTGISAYNIGGMTIHSFMGIGTGDKELNELIIKVSCNKIYRERIQKLDILIIDEISMLSADIFEKIHLICQSIRKNKFFFGGIQVVFTGDFLQLLPVFNKNKDIYNEIPDERLIIESDIFNKIFNKKNNNIKILKENFRQKNDPTFIDLLSRIRLGKQTAEDIMLLNTRKKMPENINDHIQLVSSNKKAQIINESQLANIKNESFVFTSTFTKSGDKELSELLSKELNSQFIQKGIEKLILKKNTRVMLIKNLDVSLGLINGALGTVININQSAVTIQFDNGREENISPVSWELEINNSKAIATQIPLILAYAVTCHKSQSITIDSAILDLADCFCDHQCYVALSRVRSINGIFLKSFNPKKITINKKMKTFLDKL